jgi:hypothetical protein
VGLLTILSGVAQAFATSPAHATGFDSTDEPPAIENPGVATQSGQGSSLEIELSTGLLCQSRKRVSYTVTIADPTGSISLSMRKPFSPAEPCESLVYWLPASQGEKSLDFSARGQDSPDPEVLFTPDQTTPFLLQVTGPGGIVARRAMTATATSAERIWQFREPATFTDFCVDGNHELKSENAKLYCTFGRGVSYKAGWPQPSPAIRAAPAPRYPALTRATAGKWAERAVELGFQYKLPPERFAAAHCVHGTAGRFRCNVAWLRHGYTFAGSTEVGSLNVYTGRYTYALHVIRTDPRTHARRAFSVAY